MSFTIEAGSDNLRGATRSFHSLSDAALDNSRSPIYGGIHYSFSNLDGIARGQEIGRYTFENRAPYSRPGSRALGAVRHDVSAPPASMPPGTRNIEAVTFSHL